MASHDRDLHARGPVRIGVGYGWDNEKHVLSDQRWKALRDFVTGVPIVSEELSS